MGSEWIEKPLKTLCVFLSRGIAPAYTDGDGVLVLNQKCIRNQRVNYELGRRTDPKRKPISAERMLRPFDILVNSTGVGTLGRVAQITELPEPVTVDSHVTIVRPNPEAIYPYYLGMALRCYESEIERLGEGSTGQTELSRARLGEIRVPVPESRDEQRAIARILGTLDDKIELCRRMNETLEAMAQALFKSWFVDFDPVVVNAIKAGNPIPEKFAQRAAWYGRGMPRPDDALGLPDHILRLFPARFVDSELGPIPEGWEVKALGKIASLETEAILPKDDPVTVWEHYSIPAFDEGRMPKYESGATIRSAKYKVPKSCVLVSKLNPQIPRIWLPDVVDQTHAVCSTEFLPLVPSRMKWRSLLYEIVRSDVIQEKIRAAATGSTGSRQRVRPETVTSTPMILASETLVDLLCEHLSVLQDLVLENQRQSRTLAALRDTLLPKLISGELRVPDVEKIVEDAV